MDPLTLKTLGEIADLSLLSGDFPQESTDVKSYIPCLSDFAKKFSSFGSMDVDDTHVQTAEDLERALNLHQEWILSIADPGAPISGRRLRLSSADLSGVDLSNRDLRGADLRRVNFDGANLQRCLLCHANLEDASFRRTDLRYADLSHASVKNSQLESAMLDGTLR